jgi:hypothetical protein
MDKLSKMGVGADPCIIVTTLITFEEPATEL